MKPSIMFSLENRNDFITTASDRVPGVGEIIHMPIGDYQVTEVRNLMEVRVDGRTYDITSIVVYCTEAVSPPAGGANLGNLDGEEQAWLTRILTATDFVHSTDKRMKLAILNKLIG